MDVGFKKVKPNTGRIIRFPRSYAILPETGENVPWIGADGRYWRRRVACGDCVIVPDEVEKDLFSDTLKKVKK